MNDLLIQIIRDRSQSLSPVPTGVETKLPYLHGIRAVLFDVYGTLFVSSSGEIGSASPPVIDEEAQSSSTTGMDVRIGEAFYCRFRTPVGHRDSGKTGSELISRFEAAISEMHARKREEGVPWPEVDVRKIWQRVMSEVLANEKTSAAGHSPEAWAVEYEVNTNPVWPMPGAVDCINRLGSANLVLGLISNAQFYTPLLFPALMERDLHELEISEEMQYYSYRGGRSKPDPAMFEVARATLRMIGIGPQQALYVGNDMLNDMMPAAGVGFHTALLAADQRSLRLREGDPRVARVIPDIIATNLDEVVSCVLPS